MVRSALTAQRRVNFGVEQSLVQLQNLLGYLLSLGINFSILLLDHYLSKLYERVLCLFALFDLAMLSRLTIKDPFSASLPYMPQGFVGSLSIDVTNT